ncbi:ZIP family metal transporter [[Mycoplasma] collis]|uniref:ZIP family metal transporter n=1 Tax=[Mycoplasma] collis TaxID=2127 RepID=UPI000B06B458|nr:ZIP family metal transporter [[Mycoplasma] collis]
MFPFTKSNFDLNVAITLNLLIYIFVLLAFPVILALFVAFVKPRIKKSTNTYLYALSSGILIMIATTGLLKEAFEEGEKYAHLLGEKNVINLTDINEQLIQAGIVTFGSLLGVSTLFLVRHIFIKHFQIEKHKNHEEHGHHDHIISFNDIDNPKAAWLAILLLLSHRTIDGFILGATVARVSEGRELNYGLVITFNIHIIIEILIVHYRQVQYGQTIKKAVLYNIVTIALIIPIMIVGAYINRYLRGSVQTGWILPVVNAFGGSILAFAVIIELVPEFIHLRNSGKKEWYLSLVFFGIGIILTVMLLAFHTHDTPDMADGMNKIIGGKHCHSDGHCH